MSFQNRNCLTEIQCLIFIIISLIGVVFEGLYRCFNGFFYLFELHAFNEWCETNQVYYYQ